MTRDEKIAQARTWKENGWDNDAIADELDVSETTVKKWVNDEYRLACVARTAAWRKGKGKEKRRAIVQRYRQALDSEKRAAMTKRIHRRRAARREAEKTGRPLEIVYAEWGCL